jgi:hypothetical protein
MDVVTGAIASYAANKALDGVGNFLSKSSKKDEEPAKSGDAAEFDKVLTGVLHPDEANKVSEEDLFAAIIKERLQKTKGAETADLYQKALAEKLSAGGRDEQSANEALDTLIAQGKLTPEEAAKIRSEAFAAAQLDTNLTALYDGKGGAEDPTIAVASMEEALVKARLMIEKFDSGEVTPAAFAGSYETGAADPTAMAAGVEEVPAEEAAVEEEAEAEEAEEAEEEEETEEPEETAPTPTPSTEQSALKNETLSVNPTAKKDGKLVVAIPVPMTSRVDSVVITDKNGNVIETGAVGDVKPNKRGRYHFTKTGGDYPEDVVVQVHLKNGKVKKYEVHDPSQQHHRKVKGAKNGK